MSSRLSEAHGEISADEGDVSTTLDMTEGGDARHDRGGDMTGGEERAYCRLSLMILPVLGPSQIISEGVISLTTADQG